MEQTCNAYLIDYPTVVGELSVSIVLKVDREISDADDAVVRA